MKKLAYMAPALKVADMESEELLTTSFDLDETETTDQWGKYDDVDNATGSLWD